jgi:uncharacterized protein YjiS (DUF1127 family)
MTAIRTILDRFARPLADWRERRVALDELNALDNHMLADIGICRGDIPGIVSGVVRPYDQRDAHPRNVNDNAPSVAA